MIANNMTDLRKAEFTTSNHKLDHYEIHYHSFYEIYYFLKGDVDYLVEGRQYRPTSHSLILLAPNVFHGVRINSEETYLRCAVHFSENQLSVEHRKLLLASFPGNGERKQTDVYYENTEEFDLYPYFCSLIESEENRIKNKTEENNQIYQICLEALLAKIRFMCQIKQPTTIESHVPIAIKQIIQYLNENLGEQITLDLLSEKFYISKHYMNRAFRKATGTTVMDYLTYKRLTFARQLILNGYPIMEASLQAGFNDYSSFYRAYRKIYGCAPGKI